MVVPLGRARSPCTAEVVVASDLVSFSVLQAAAQTPQGQGKRIQRDSKEVSDLLDQAKMQAAQLKNDATDMQTFPQLNLSWKTHADKIMAIKQDINNVGQTIAKLNAAESAASPWQKTAIERINPLLKELADNTTAIIDHLNRERGRLLNTPEHKDLLNDNAELATDLSTVIGDFVEYGQTRAKYFELSSLLKNVVLLQL
jgi:hypothetical protein